MGWAEEIIKDKASDATSTLVDADFFPEFLIAEDFHTYNIIFKVIGFFVSLITLTTAMFWGYMFFFERIDWINRRRLHYYMMHVFPRGVVSVKKCGSLNVVDLILYDKYKLTYWGNRYKHTLWSKDDSYLYLCGFIGGGKNDRKRHREIGERLEKYIKENVS